MHFVYSFTFLWLLHAGRCLEIHCPYNCDCSWDGRLTAECSRLPNLQNSIVDLNTLQIENLIDRCPISEDLLKFTNLETLQVTNCPIDLNIRAFKDLSNLQKVVFHNVSLDHLDPTLFEANRHLKTVNFSSNPLHIRKHLLISASIEQVNLNNCNLSTIPSKAFTQLLNLKTLTLENNNLTTFDVVLPSTLTNLDLSNNKLKAISLRILQPLRNLTKLNLRGNPLLCSCNLKLIEKYLSVKNATFLAPERCISEDNLIPLADISIAQICSNVIDHSRVRRYAHHLLTKRESPKTYKFSVNKIEGEIRTIGGAGGDTESDLKSDQKGNEKDDEKPDENNDENSDSTPSNTSEKPGSKPIIPNSLFYTVIGAIIVVVVMVIIIMIALLCFIIHRNDCQNQMITIECTKKICEKASPHETETLCKPSRRSSRARKGTCRICPSTLGGRKQSEVTMRSCHCDEQNASDTETVTNDYDCSATDTADSSTYTTMLRHC